MEDAYFIKGGRPLRGVVKLSGAKNVALKVIIAALMFEGPVILKNIPKINDVLELLHLIKLLGGKAEFIEENTVEIDGRTIDKNQVDLLHGSKIRVSFMFFAPLLQRFGECYIPNPGGCRIGVRPIDRIIEGMKKLGIETEYSSATGFYQARMIKSPRGEYRFSKSSHTGTELLILIGLLGKEKIIIENAALEPEIDDLIDFLNQGNGNIKRSGAKITVFPSLSLRQKNPYTIICDRNEAVTYASAAVATKGEVKLGPISFSLIKTFFDKLQSVGGGCKRLDNDWYEFFYKGELKSSKIETSPHPGFMTDWQQNWAVLMTQARGESVIIERVFENRFSYVKELRKLGVKIDFINFSITNPSQYFFFNFYPAKKYQQAIKIKGPQKLHGGVLNITDLRAGATLAIGALVAEGESVICGASILERGYENFVEKVKSLGGEIKRL